MQTPRTRILGVDPGLNITGYGVLEVARNRIQVCEAGVVRGRTPLNGRDPAFKTQHRQVARSQMSYVAFGDRTDLDTFRFRGEFEARVGHLFCRLIAALP